MHYETIVSADQLRDMLENPDLVIFDCRHDLMKPEAGAAAYAEDGWRELRVGEARLRAAKPCGRCEVTTTDQATGEVRGPEPLATLGEYRSSNEFGVMFGLNLVTLEQGWIRKGDTVELRELQTIKGTG